MHDTVYVEAAVPTASTLYDQARQAVVLITGDDALGTGFFIDPNTIVTNYHVIRGSKRISCSANGVDIPITGFSNIDYENDIVLLNTSFDSPAYIASATSNPQVGEHVYAIGHPQGFNSTLSEGLVSGLRDINGRKLIQISAPISPGSSGGPVVSPDGKLIGVAVLSYMDGQNLNFAVPKDVLKLCYDFRSRYALDLDSILNKDLQYTTVTLDDVTSGSTESYGIANDCEYLNPFLSLDAIVNYEKSTMLFFTYTWQSSESIESTMWLDEMHIIDPLSKKVYTAYSSNLGNSKNPRKVYRGVSSRFHVSFPRLPDDVRLFNLVEGGCTSGSFCMRNIRRRYTSQLEIESNLREYTDSQNYGTFCFYNKGVGDEGYIDVQIRGVDIGRLTQYFPATSTILCGNAGAITIALPEGEYEWRAQSQDGSVWKGTANITRNECKPIGLRE